VVATGYIHFSDHIGLKPPTWVPARTKVNIWLDIRGMTQTMIQLEHKTRYLWRGEFANGHVYADLHSTS